MFTYNNGITYIPTWNNNRENKDKPIIFKLNLLKLKDYWTVLGICKEIEENKNNITPEIIIDVCDRLRPILSSYIVNIENIMVDNKIPSPEELIDYPVFFELIMEVLLELVNVSSLQEQDKKKLKK